MNIIIIDDEPLAQSIVAEYVQTIPNIQILATCSDGFEGLKAIQQYKPDLIFLDIQMPRINGFEMLELVEHKPAVIFTTAFDEYAIKAFEANAIDYLLKPFSKERFDIAMQKVSKQIPNTVGTEVLLQHAALQPQQQNRIVVKDGHKIKIIPTVQVHFLEASDDYVKIHIAEGSFLKKKRMAEFEASLDAQMFVRCHRSFIINTQLITRIDLHEKDSYIVTLSTGKQLPVSKSGYIKLKQILGI